jgi:hypothetical protein
MFRCFLFMVGVMATSAGMAGNVSPCPVGTVPIQIMMPSGGTGVMRSAAEISNDFPYFRAFVTAVTEHIAARLARDKLCITGAKSMSSAEREDRSLLQFVYWNYVMLHEYTVPVMAYGSRGRTPSSCWISSPWIDFAIERGAVPSIRGIVYWNERQLLADQAVLAGTRNVPPGMAMPLKPSELGHFRSEYGRLGRLRRESAKKPIEARVPPDILWLFRGTLPDGGRSTLLPFRVLENKFMYGVIKESAEGYAKLVLALIDRCLASSGAAFHHYSSILDVTDPVLLKQYRIDTPPSR